MQELNEKQLLENIYQDINDLYLNQDKWIKGKNELEANQAMKKFIDNTLKEGLSLILDLDVQGADSFKRYFGDMANVIFISPPSIETLEQRLKARATDLEEVIKVRLENAKREILRKDDFDYCLINDNFENAYRELKKIVEEILGD